MTEFVPLKRVARLSYGDSLPSERRVTGDVPIMGSGGVSDFHSTSNAGSPAIVVGRKGSYGSIFWASDGAFVIDTAYFVDVATSTCDLRWLYYALQAVDLKGASQDVGVPGLSREAAHDTLIPEPGSLEEQRRIADFLDAETSRIDALMSKYESAVSSLEERHVSLKSWLLFGKGRNEDVRRESGIPAIGNVPNYWRIVRNKHLLRESCEASADGSEELLTVSHITGVTPRSEKEVHMFMAESHEGYKICRAGDLIINTMWAWMGALGVADRLGIVSPAYGVYRPTNENFYEPYFDLVYRSPEYVCEMTRFSKGVWTSRLRLYPESFLGLTSPVPPLREQREIVDGIQEEVNPQQEMQQALHKAKDLLRERKQALITAAVTGQIDVTTAGRATSDLRA